MRANMMAVVLAVAVSAVVGRCDGGVDLGGDLPADAGAADDVLDVEVPVVCGCDAELAELRGQVGELRERADWTDTRIRDTAGILADQIADLRVDADVMRDQVAELRRRVEVLEGR